MSDVPIIGGVGVSVTPNAEGFSEKLSAQILPQAGALGTQWGAAFKAAVEKEIGDRLRVGPPASENTRQGASAGGQFADAFRARVEAALKALPPIQIGAATTEAEQKLRDIRVELADLSHQVVGVDISDEQALVKLAELRARLAQLNESTDSVQVQADTAAAIAQLDRFKAELDRLNSEDVDVDVNADDHGSIAAADAKISALNETAGSTADDGLTRMQKRILEIGSAALLAADIAIPALLAIGAAAGGILGAVGVLALGGSGIIGAVSAAGKPAKTSGSGSPNGQASAALNAQQATQSAADQYRQALEAQQNAEVSLTKAQRDAVTAQTALTAARVQAKYDLQDDANAVTDNALAQQQAALTLQQAKQTLALTLAAPGAGLAQYAPQVAAAKLAVAEATQNSKELAEQGQRAATAKTAADKAGVNGAPGVISAQGAVTDAHTTLTKAQQAVVDAAHQVAEAQANITTTAEKNKLALASAAGGADAFGTALAKLNPVEQQFVTFWLTLKPLFDELKTAASEFLPGLEQGIKDAEPAFKPLLALVGSVAKALGGVFEAIGTGLASPAGQKFLTFLSIELPKVIGSLGTGLVGFGTTLANVFEAAAPLISAFSTAFSGIFSALEAGSGGKGLQDFFNGLIPLMQPLAQGLEAIGGLIAAVLPALIPLVGPLLKFITLLATELTKLAQPVIEPLARLVGQLLTALSPLLPLFEQLIEAIIPPLITLLSSLITDGIGPLVISLANSLGPLLPTITTDLTQMIAAITPLIPALTEILTAIAPLIAPVTKLFIDTFTASTPLLVAITPLLTTLANVLSKTLTPVVRGLADLFAGLDTGIHDTFNGMADLVHAGLTAVVKVFDAMKAPFAAAWDDILGVFGEIGSGVLGGITSVFDAIIAGINLGITAVDAVIKGINAVSGGLSDLWKWTGVPGIPKIPLIPHFDVNSSSPSGSSHVPTVGPIHAMAEGGIAMPRPGGHIIRVAEAGFPEGIIPLSKLNDVVKGMNPKFGGRTNNFYLNGYTDPNAAARAAIGKMAARAV